MSQYKYQYSKEFQTLQQIDKNSGKLISSMPLPIEDLDRIAFLAWMLEIEKQQTHEVSNTTVTTKE